VGAQLRVDEESQAPTAWKVELEVGGKITHHEGMISPQQRRKTTVRLWRASQEASAWTDRDRQLLLGHAAPHVELVGPGLHLADPDPGHSARLSVEQATRWTENCDQGIAREIDALDVTRPRLVQLGDDRVDQLGWLDHAGVRSPFEDPRHDRYEVRAWEREHDTAIRAVLDDLRRMPAAHGYQRCFVAAEFDHDALRLSCIAHADTERTMKNVCDGEVGWNFERSITDVVGVDEPFDSEHAERPAPVAEILGPAWIASATPDDLKPVPIQEHRERREMATLRATPRVLVAVADESGAASIFAVRRPR